MAVEGSLKIREVAKFESERLKTYKDMTPQSPLKCLQALWVRTVMLGFIKNW